MKKEKIDIYDTLWHATFGQCTSDVDGVSGGTYGASLHMAAYGKINQTVDIVRTRNQGDH